jgi:cyclomaltodextrinase / maltogenic alpha-amylase / neopullulanase
MTKFHTPDWVKDAVFYQIFPDRFAKSSRLQKPSNLEPWDSKPTIRGFKGGDLLGVLEKLDYLQDLGINAIYLNPVFKSAANHRYHTYDYFNVDPLLGGNESLRSLLDEAHGRGIRIILDGVFNHASRGFYKFHHILENGPSSPYIDWFIIKKFPVRAYDEEGEPNYAAWWGLHALPKFNIRNPAVREYLWNVARYWIDFGIDGWRLDVPEEIDDPSFWQEFRRKVKSLKPDAYLVGEIWHAAKEWLEGDKFDAVMNYLLNKACVGFFIDKEVDETLVRGMGYAPIPHLDSEHFGEAIDRLLNLYVHEVNISLLNLLSSHDTARFLTLARGDECALRLAILFLMTLPGVPCIYYGDEIGMEGGRDPDCRRSFPWDRGKWNSNLLDYFKRCISLRIKYPSLRRGDFKRLYSKEDVYAFARRLGDETLIVVLNVAKVIRAPKIQIDDFLPEGALLREIWDNSTISVHNGILNGLVLSPRSGSVLLVEKITNKISESNNQPSLY